MPEPLLIINNIFIIILCTAFIRESIKAAIVLQDNTYTICYIFWGIISTKAYTVMVIAIMIRSYHV